MLANVPPRGPRDGDDWWDNLRNMYRRWESDEVAGATVLAAYRGRTYRTVTDDEGYFTFEIDLETEDAAPSTYSDFVAGGSKTHEAAFDPGTTRSNGTVRGRGKSAAADPVRSVNEGGRSSPSSSVDPTIEEFAPQEGGSRLWHLVHLTLDEPDAREDGVARATGRIYAVPPTARFGVISDVDDTVIESGITNLFTAARVTFLNNARTRVPLPGVSELYRAFRRGVGGADTPEDGSGNPIFYVSSSAWNLYDLIRDFLDLNDIPLGPVLLRALGPGGQSLKQGHSHKLEKAERVMEAYPHLRFVLIGDSGQHDAQLYLEAARRHRDRILAIYIRDIHPHRSTRKDEQVRECADEAAALGVPMLLAPDSRSIAEHAFQLGLIDPAALPTIRSQVSADRSTAESGYGVKEAALAHPASRAGLPMPSATTFDEGSLSEGDGDGDGDGDG